MVQAFEQPAVRVETEGVVPPEVASEVVELASAALTDLEKAKETADEVVEAPATQGEGVNPSLSFALLH